MNHTVVPLSRWVFALVVIALPIAGFIVGIDVGRSVVSKDCTALNQTVINGQHILCKPYNPNPKRVM